MHEIHLCGIVTQKSQAPQKLYLICQHAEESTFLFLKEKVVARRSFALLEPLLQLQCLQPSTSHFQLFLCL